MIASLNQALAWYRQARLVMRAVNVNAGPLFSREDQQTAAHLVQRAFDVADAQAALIAADRRAELGTQKSSSNDKRDGLQAAIQRDEVEVERLARRLGQVPAAQRTDAARELAAASNQLELDRTRLSFLTDLAKLEAAAATPELDLAHQIQALRDSVPELRAPDAVDSPPVNTSTTTWALLQRLVALQRSRGSLADLDRATETIARTADTDLRGVRNVVRPIMARLQVLAKEPGAQGRSLPQDQQEFHDLLERLKVLGRVVLPLQQEAALARRFAGELDGRQTAINRESLHSLQDIGVQLIGVVVAMAIIFVVGLVWRIATLRYVSDPYRRRLLLNARRIVLIAAVTLVLVFHFTSELAALVTALGFAAAGIAFALQTVILAIAGYFSILGPHGIRVGDRVSLQGPFGYVHGEVVEIGLVRIKLRELTGDPPQPTGRIVVFPNSVVFTGGFFKHPVGQQPPETGARAA